MPFEKLFSAKINKEKKLFTYIKEHNHFYCLFLEKNDELVLKPIKLAPYIDVPVNIKELEFINGEFRLTTSN